MFLIWGLLTSVLAQSPSPSVTDSLAESPVIQWISQIPDTSKGAPQTNIKDRILNFFFGKKEPLFMRPFSVYVTNSGVLWILDQGKGAVIRLDHKVGKITHFRWKKKSNFPSLVGICGTQDEEILFTDSQLNKIFFLSPEYSFPQILNDSLTLQRPTGIAYSNITNEIWVVETTAHRISVLNRKGERIRTIGKRGTDPGEFNYPTFIWIDQNGIVYVVDSMNFRVQLLDDQGEVLSMFGEAGDATGYLTRPKGIATDSYGHIYLVDALFHAVQVFDRDGNFLTTFGHQGRGKEEFWLPSGIFIDSEDYIYVIDGYNARIQIFQFIPAREK